MLVVDNKYTCYGLQVFSVYINPSIQTKVKIVITIKL